jgi:hypothetical protein
MLVNMLFPFCGAETELLILSCARGKVNDLQAPAIGRLARPVFAGDRMGCNFVRECGKDARP